MSPEKYIGMDVHATTISAVVKNAEGKLLADEWERSESIPRLPRVITSVTSSRDPNHTTAFLLGLAWCVALSCRAHRVQSCSLAAALERRRSA